MRLDSVFDIDELGILDQRYEVAITQVSVFCGTGGHRVSPRAVLAIVRRAAYRCAPLNHVDRRLENPQRLELILPQTAAAAALLLE